MKQLIVDIVDFILKLFGYGILSYKQIPINNLRLFLTKLRPIKTDYELIRIGSENDGGYLLPNDLNNIKYCFSPGVSTNSSFEETLYQTYGIKSFLCDFSVDSPPINCEGFDFLKKYLNSYSDDQNMTLTQWIENSGNLDGDLILQMDIEGFEYDVLAHTSIEVLKKFRILVIEFHELDKLHTNIGYKMITSVFNKLLDEFYIVHYHPNNYSNAQDYAGIRIFPLGEFTFIRKDRVSNTFGYESLPNILDMVNVPGKKAKSLPKNVFFE